MPTSSSFSYFPASIPQLPPRDLAIHFIDRYFRDVNEILCVLSYNDFGSWYHHMSPDKPFEPVKRVILFTVFAFGCKDDINGAADTYFSYALQSVGLVMQQGGLEAIQA